MTKKRFVKLIMGKGYSRNEAVLLASSKNDSYSELYSELTDPVVAIAKAFEQFLNQAIMGPIKSLSAELVNVWKPLAIISDNNLHLPAKTYMKGDENRE